MSMIETIEVTYLEIVEAMKSYYGNEIFAKIMSGTIADFLIAIKSLPNYNAIISASGNIIGYEKAITTTIATGATSTATKTIATTSAFGATATESGVVATGVGQSVAGTAGSFIFGEVLPAIGAVAVGTVLGVGIDTLIYQSNPDYWDKTLPTINPQTWDDIILGHDTKIPLLHNTQDSKTYISEEAFAYATKAYLEAGIFNASEYIEKSDSNHSDVKIFPHKGGFSFKTTGDPASISSIAIVESVESTAQEDICFFMSPLTNVDGYGKYGEIYIATKNTLNLATTYLNLIEYDSKGNEIPSRVKINFFGANYDTNNRYYWSPVAMARSAEGIVLSSYPANTAMSTLLHVLFDGDSTKINKDIPEGYFLIDGAIIPSGLKDSDSINEIKTKLKSLYPELYNNAINFPVIQNDGSATTQLWLPVQIPSIYINGNPVSNNSTQTFDGTYPSEEIKNEAIENVITPSIKTGIENGNPANDNQTGDEETPPIVAPITPIQTGLGAVYTPTLEQLKNFSAWLWTSDIIEQLKRFFANPMDGIIGLHQVFFTPTVDGTEKIQTGYLTSTVDSSYTTKRYYTIDCGEIELKEKSGNVFDYSPYTSVELYLPFIGIVPIDVGAVMRSTISVKYECDVLTGACLANVEVNRDGNKNIMYSFGGSCSLQYPISSGTYIGIIGAVAGIALNVGSAIATGGTSIPLNIGGIAGSMSSARTSVASSGGYSGNTGSMGIKKPYLIIKRYFKAMPKNYYEYIGNPFRNTTTLGELNGYTECEVVHINGTMTAEEKTEIENILKNGVII